MPSYLKWPFPHMYSLYWTLRHKRVREKRIFGLKQAWEMWLLFYWRDLSFYTLDLYILVSKLETLFRVLWIRREGLRPIIIVNYLFEDSLDHFVSFKFIFFLEVLCCSMHSILIPWLVGESNVLFHSVWALSSP